MSEAENAHDPGSSNMSPAPTRNLRELFLQAAEIEDTDARRAFLSQACGEDAELRRRLEELLAADDQAGPVPSSRTGAGESESVGLVIGRYKLLEKIGEGGCGVVYVAEQQEPVRRRVALKIIKLGMDTRSVVARFEAERQALALMDHPNIAKVLDAGATDTGRPYFVMELVRGLKITDYCDQHQLSTAERLELFMQVCRAVQHAHQKGIIHRDLKPSNILVTVNDGVAVPKVIDFGIAKATEGRLTDKTVYTELHQFIGTPAYMSPEQAELTSVDIDTRSDIYSLGVLLYELLTGRTPFEHQELVKIGLDAMRQIIRTKEPPRPSTRLSTLAAAELSTVAQAHRSEPPKLIHSVRGDLDWIVMKCLEKDRGRRYETASGLAREIERHLHNEPVVARPPSHLYRFGKVVRRNQLAFAAAAMIAIALLAGTVLTTWQAVRASRERDAKELALREQTRLREQAQAAQREESSLREQAQAETYASDMLLAQQAIAANNFGFARELLYRQRPQSASEKDLRGWEWRYLWEQCTSDVLAKVWQGNSRISNLRCSSDGRWLAIGQSSLEAAVSLLKFVDRTTVVLVTNIPASRATDVDVAFSSTAPLLAFSSSRYEGTRPQFTLHLRNLETGQVLFEKPIRSFCDGLEFSPDGSTLLACLINIDLGSTNGGLRLLRVPQGDLVWDCPTSISNPNWGVAVDPAFRTAAVGGDRLQVIDLAKGEVRWSATNEYFRGAAFTRDGRGLFTAEGWPTVLQAREVSSGKLIGSPVPLPSAEMGGLTLLPDGKTLLSINHDGSTQFFDVSDPAQPRPLGRPLRGQVGQITDHALSHRGETLLTGSWGGSVYAWDTKPPPPDQPLIVLAGVFAWQFAPDSRSIVTVDPQGHVERREGPDFQLKRPLLDIEVSLVSIRARAEFSDDGRWLASSQDPDVRIWDLQTPSLAPRVLRGMLVDHSFAARGELLVVFDPESDSAQEWDLLTFQKVRSWSSLLPRRGAPLLALSAGGKYRLNATVLGTEVSLIEAGATQATMRTNLGIVGISDANFAPDGRLFAVASMGGSAQVRENASGQPVTTVGRRQFPIESVGFSEDGSRLVTASDAAGLTLWDMSGHELLALRVAWGGGPFSLFDSPRFSADGGRMLGWCSSQNGLYLWRAPSWAEIEAVEKGASNLR